MDKNSGAERWLKRKQWSFVFWIFHTIQFIKENKKRGKSWKLALNQGEKMMPIESKNPSNNQTNIVSHELTICVFHSKMVKGRFHRREGQDKNLASN